MSGEWQPGEIALWDIGEGRTEVIFRFLAGEDFDIPEWQTAVDGCGYPVPSDLRRPAVIDPENEPQVQALVEAFLGQTGLVGGWKRMQAALREFADPKPPKPEEPTGLGAVVEDADGKRWTRNAFDRDNGLAVWWRPGGGGWTAYSLIDAVRVLSEGVQP